jgi:dGTPase
MGDDGIGAFNPEIINNLEVNIIENSYGKPYIKLDEEHYLGLKAAKKANYAMIYNDKRVAQVLDDQVRPLMQKMYYKLLGDIKAGNTNSPVFKHHIDFVTSNHYASPIPYIETEPNQIVVDYMASMTDDYCAELYKYLFPSETLTLSYYGYFDDLIH